MQEGYNQEDVERAKKLFPIYEARPHPAVVLKECFQAVAMRIMAIQREAKTPEAKRSASVALTDLETSSMYAVKALHQG